MKVYLITIGDEILIGQIVNTNAAWIGEQMGLIGGRIIESASVGDRHEAILDILERACAKADVVLCTGGLGPTKDDITKKALADFCGVPMVFDQSTYDHISRFFQRLGREPGKYHRDQSFMPEGFTLLPNKMGTAPGMWTEHKGTIIVSMPGVPYEMQYLMEAEVMPRLRTTFGTREVAHRTLLTAGKGETDVAERIEAFENALPEHIRLAYLPSLGAVRLRLTGEGPHGSGIAAELDALSRQLEALIPELVFGYDKDTLEAAVGRLLREKPATLAVAESCTGGFLSHRITAVAGSSDYFLGGTVAYANSAKTRLLGVPEAVLQEHGAVSEPTVGAMVEGVRKQFGATYGVATTGIAGPGGGTPEKPVGTVWLAVSDGAQIRTHKLQLGKDRLKNIEYSANYALNMLRLLITENTGAC